MRDDLDQVRGIEGFPIGEDEDLHALSDPPRYTAYPNPHIQEFIEKWGTPCDEAADDYHREPYVSDVSEGKSGPIYSAHSYHTKVPYKAIVPFIKHYTEPGDIVFDGFCGTGMTGVATQLVDRRAVLSDLAPIATFIASTYNAKVDRMEFVREARRISMEVQAECGWMYETAHPGTRTLEGQPAKGTIIYTVWSDVFVCPYCSQEIVFYDAGMDTESGRLKSKFACPKCGSALSKRALDHATERVHDRVIGMDIVRNKQVPVLISYKFGTKRFEKRPDSDDIALIRRIEESEIPYWHPSYRMLFRDGAWGDIWRAGYHTGVTHCHHFYTRRNLWVLAALWEKSSVPAVRWALSSIQNYINKKQSYTGGGGGMPGVLYIASLVQEKNVLDVFRRKVKRLSKAFRVSRTSGYAVISTQSATSLPNIPSESVDYVFTDPPFGSNIMYSEGSFLWESWLRVFTNDRAEAIINSTQKKDLEAYRSLMTRSFAEMYRILKPGRWITVVFHNSKAAVWNAIQESLSHAGFLVAQVTVMDKQQGSFKQVTSAGAVKNDLVISAYKPRTGFVKRMLSDAGRGVEADFVRQHLRHLPTAANIERSAEMLYSKYLAYYVQRGYQVAYNGEQFYRALSQWGLVELDGYWFADEAQANEYEKRKAKLVTPKGRYAQQQQQLFISDEKSARRWLWNFLETPQTYDAIYTAFVKALQTSEDEIPELTEMLSEGFVRTNGTWKRPDALTREELEQKRQARLLRQFADYLADAQRGQAIKEVRKEAVLEGFTDAYRSGRYQEILTVGRKLPSRLVEESPDLRDFIEIAEAKLES